MTQKTIIHCDKCDSTNVIHEQVVFKPQELHKKMTEIVEESKNSKTTFDVYYFTNTYKMICKDCAYFLEYQK